MAKYTTTIHDYIRNELINAGYDEFFRVDRFTNGSFITDLIKYDAELQTPNINKEVINVMRKSIFENFYFTTEDLDNFFKLTFLYNFYYHEIKFQTIELFKLKLFAYMNEHKQYIQFIWNNHDKIISGSSTDEGETKNTNLMQNRSATSSTPQDKLNLNVENNTLEYADENIVGLQKGENKITNSNKKSNLNISDIYLVSTLFSRIFEEMEEKLFLQIF